MKRIRFIAALVFFYIFTTILFESSLACSTDPDCYGKEPHPQRYVGVGNGKHSLQIQHTHWVQGTYGGSSYYIASWETIQTEECIPIIDEGIAATCTTSGKTEGSHCILCNQILEKQVAIKPTGHKSAIDKEIPATCTDEGLTTGVHCSECGYVIIEQQPIPALGHQWGDPSYEWSADSHTLTASHSCIRNKEHFETESVPATGEIINSPDFETEGKVLFTSDSFHKQSFSVQTKETSIPPLNTLQLLKLPSNLGRIEDSAFESVTCEAIIVPDCCAFIGSHAFANCSNLIYIRIPANISYVANDAFDGSTQVIIDFNNQ